MMITTQTARATRQPAQTTALTVLTLLAVSAPACFVGLTAAAGGPVAYAGLVVLLSLPVAVATASWRGRQRLSLVLLGAAAALSLISVVLVGF